MGVLTLHMNRTSLGVVLLVILVVFAGCAGLPGGGPSTDAPPTPREGTPTLDEGTPRGGTPTLDEGTPREDLPTLSEGELPAGVTRDGIANATLVTRRNAEVLVETGYVSDLQIDATLSFQGQTRNTTLLQRETVTKGASSFLFQSAQLQAGQTARSTVWSNGSIALLRSVQGNQTQYRRIAPERITSQLAAQQVLADYIGTGDYTISEVSREDGRTLITLTADEYVTQTRAELPAPENVSRFESTVVIDSDGRIHNATISLAVERSRSQRFAFALRYKLTKLGDVRVDRPEWVQEALAQTAANESTS